MSKIHVLPLSLTSLTACTLVPYKLLPNCAFSMNPLASTSFVKSSRDTKWYSRPFSSPARGPRVVCEMLKPKRSGYSANRRLRRVDFPAPEGPETTMGRWSEEEEGVSQRFGRVICRVLNVPVEDIVRAERAKV
jgi:hypothetical protein